MRELGFAGVCLLFSVAAQAYLLGCFNGAILVSRLCYHDDVRNHGSGNAGLTNFLRTFGKKFAFFVIAADMGKAALALLVGSVLLEYYFGFGLAGRCFAAFFCVLGHIFPAFYDGKGGKGILCCGTLLLFLNWRVALVSWGLFFLLVCLTRYVSLGSIAAAAAFPVTTCLVYRELCLTTLAVLISVTVIFAHRENISRLYRGTENKLTFRGHRSEEEV